AGRCGATRFECLPRVCKGCPARILFYCSSQLEPCLQWWRGSPGARPRRRKRIIGRGIEDRRARDGSFLESSGGRWWLGRRDWLLDLWFPLCLYCGRSSATRGQARRRRTISVARRKTNGLLSDCLQPGIEIERQLWRLEWAR